MFPQVQHTGQKRLLPFDNDAEVLARANNSEMGLAAHAYTGDLNCAMRPADRNTTWSLSTSRNSKARLSPPEDGSNPVWAEREPGMASQSISIQNTRALATLRLERMQLFSMTITLRRQRRIKVGR